MNTNLSFMIFLSVLTLLISSCDFSNMNIFMCPTDICSELAYSVVGQVLLIIENL